MCDREGRRKKYKPSGRINVLFVGESPPEKTYFYCCDSNLFHWFIEAFLHVPELRVSTNDCERFLDCFQRMGMYIEDISGTPINYEKSKSKRKTLRKDAAKDLTDRLRKLQPARVVALMKGIGDLVDSKVSEAELTIDHPIPSVNFPTNGHQHQFVEDMAALLREYLREGAISPCN